MNIILVSDVFGKTPALMKLSEELNANIIVDPYDGINMNFKNEEEAYSYFINNVGLDKYLSKLLEITMSISSVTTLIGFSIGASVIWKLSENSAVKNIKSGICYYGSQIRNLKEINPLFEVELIFPKMETHFDVLQLQSELCKKQNVKTMKVNYLHGFMNFYSINYNQVAYKEQLIWLHLNTIK
jgi:hypothetical protein